MSTPRKQRAAILKAVRDLVRTRFAADAGTVGRYFRDTRLGPMRPGSGKWPVATITDAGQTGTTGGEDADSADRTLAIDVTLQLADNWLTVDANTEWSDRVEELIEAVSKNLPAGCGVTRMRYVDDDPADVVFASGQAEAAWSIRFEAEYAAPDQHEE